MGYLKGEVWSGVEVPVAFADEVAKAGWEGDRLGVSLRGDDGMEGIGME